LGPRFLSALAYATKLHALQTRKGSRVPYVAHLLAVASTTIEAGGSEDQVIAALLHDAVEDQGGVSTLRKIRRMFGPEVASIVEACTDTPEAPKPPWRERKEQHLAQLKDSAADVALVVAADKLHNARTILADYRKIGDQLFERFNGGKAGTLWYYRSMQQMLKTKGPEAVVEELDRVVTELERISARKTKR
jgi:GTP pyrophosphokinase